MNNKRRTYKYHSGAYLHNGDRLLIRFPGKNSNNMTYHVRGFVDNRVVVKSWSYTRKIWIYSVLPDWFFIAYRDYLKVSTLIEAV